MEKLESKNKNEKENLLPGPATPGGAPCFCAFRLHVVVR